MPVLNDIEKEIFLDQLGDDLAQLGVDEDTITCIIDEARDADVTSIEITMPSNFH